MNPNHSKRLWCQGWLSQLFSFSWLCIPSFRLMASLSLRNQHPGVNLWTLQTRPAHTVNSSPLILVDKDSKHRRTVAVHIRPMNGHIIQPDTDSHDFALLLQQRRSYASGSAPLSLGCVLRRAAENDSNRLISQITHPAVCRLANGVGCPLSASLATFPKTITETAMLYASWRYFDGGTTCTSLRWRPDI